MSDPAGMTTGQRIEFYRKRLGMSRPVLAGLVGRSAEWVKAVEIGRLHTPRLEMLLKIARALGIRDLADLTGDGLAMPVESFAGEAHANLPAVQAALTEYTLAPREEEPLSIPHLAMRLRDAWRVHHSSPNQRTAVGSVLPDLIRDARQAVRATTGADRRQARRVLAGVYRLADMYLALQPVPELCWLVADRAMAEGQEADDPHAIAGGAMCLSSLLRNCGRWEEATSVAGEGSRLLEPWLERTEDDDWRAAWGALQFVTGHVQARSGRYGDAWAAWERAHDMATRLGPGYQHPDTAFSVASMSAHAVSLDVELRRPGEALRTANTFDPERIPSIPRRGRHLVYVARAHYQRGDYVAACAMLDMAEQTAPEIVRYDRYSREMLLGLAANPPTGMRDVVRELCGRVGVRL
ncbi:MAG: helix-turn-helix domain-containing protein [Pseudonocardiaceae bacterium]